VYHPVNQDDWQLLAHAMASDFTVAWQFLLNRTIGLRIKLHAQAGVIVLITIISSIFQQEKNQKSELWLQNFPKREIGGDH
jgi:hypothetical protein